LVKYDLSGNILNVMNFSSSIYPNSKGLVANSQYLYLTMEVTVNGLRPIDMRDLDGALIKRVYINFPVLDRLLATEEAVYFVHEPVTGKFYMVKMDILLSNTIWNVTCANLTVAENHIREYNDVLYSFSQNFTVKRSASTGAMIGTDNLEGKQIFALAVDEVGFYVLYQGFLLIQYEHLTNTPLRQFQLAYEKTDASYRSLVFTNSRFVIMQQCNNSVTDPIVYPNKWCNNPKLLVWNKYGNSTPPTTPKLLSSFTPTSTPLNSIITSTTPLSSIITSTSQTPSSSIALNIQTSTSSDPPSSAPIPPPPTTDTNSRKTEDSRPSGPPIIEFLNSADSVNSREALIKLGMLFGIYLIAIN
jgi:hypothetical protein